MTEMTIQQTRSEGRRQRTLVLGVIVLGCLFRLIGLAALPAGLNQDEAYAGYEAWSLLTSGVDSAGYHNPVYLVAWGSGMNALESYLMMPFIDLLGLTKTAVRLPQALCACLALPAFYGVLKRSFDRRTAFAGLCLLAACPWHIMAARWGLESNLAPDFLLFGLYCFVRGLENRRWLVLCALCYGLSLYTYATIWPIVPLLVGSQALWALLSRRVRVREPLLPAGVLFALALPLLWFLLVNWGLVPEVRTALFSIPKMPYFRGSEISLSQTGANLAQFFSVLLSQQDGLPWNSMPVFGLYYPFALPLFALGVWALIGDLRRGGWRAPALLVALQILCTFPLGALILVNVNRMNAVHMPILLVLGRGAGWLLERLPRWGRRAAAGGLALLCAAFLWCYAGPYNKGLGPCFHQDFPAALDAALACADGGTVRLSAQTHRSLLLFYTRMPAEEYIGTVEYDGAYRPLRFGQFELSDAIGASGVYLVDAGRTAEFAAAGYECMTFGDHTVAVRPG